MRGPTLRRLALSFAALALTAGCAAALRQPTPADASAVAPSWPGTSLEDLARGRASYVRRCAGCHALVLPSARAPRAWPALVERMAARARLSPRQTLDIQRFLVAVARDAPAEAASPSRR